MNWYILAIFPVLGLLVLVHELGHFLTAKWAGIRVEEFGLGLPPAVVGIRKRDQGGWEVMWFGRSREVDTSATQNPLLGVSGGTGAANASQHTIYSLNLLPIGGFVRMPGETGDAYDSEGNYDPQSFAAKSAGKRIIVLCAGVVMNVLLACVLFTIAYSLGEPQPVTTATIGMVLAGSPAEHAGLKPNDTVTQVDGVAVKTFEDMRTQVQKKIDADHGKDNTVHLTLIVNRPGEAQPLTIPIDARTHAAPDQGAMGVQQKINYVTTPFWKAPIKGVVHTYEATRDFIVAIGQMITGSIQAQFAGPVGIARITGDVAQTIPVVGWWYILSFTAILSLNLAIFNILPFPALDGGRVLLILIELLRGGKRLKPEREGLINFIGIAILLLLMLVVTVSDVLHWGS